MENERRERVLGEHGVDGRLRLLPGVLVVAKAPPDHADDTHVVLDAGLEQVFPNALLAAFCTPRYPQHRVKEIGPGRDAPGAYTRTMVAPIDFIFLKSLLILSKLLLWSLQSEISMG